MPRWLTEDRLRSLRAIRGRIRGAVWSLGRPARGADDLAEYCLTFRRRQPLRELSRRFEYPRLQGTFDHWAQSERLEYLYRYTGKAMIDPLCGFIVAERLGPLLPSLMESDFAAMPSQTMHLERLPSRFRYAMAKRLGRPGVIHLERAVSLRALSEANYWHFYHDVLSKLRLLEEFGIGNDVPLVVAESLYNMPYFQEAIQRPKLADRQFVPQDLQTYVAAKEVIFGTTMGYDKENFEYVRRVLDAPEPDLSSTRRIFLLRGQGRSRRIINIDQVRAVTGRYGFEVVDTDTMSLADQMALFASARYIVGSHGAGLVNLMYRGGAPLGLIELFSPRHIAPHYYWLATDYGYDYEPLVGDDTPDQSPDRSFIVDPGQLEAKIKAMVGKT